MGLVELGEDGGGAFVGKAGRAVAGIGAENAGAINTADAMVGGIGNEDISIRVNGDGGRPVKKAGGSGAAITSEPGKAIAGGRGDQTAGSDHRRAWLPESAT